jgi:hypothetical protein
MSAIRRFAFITGFILGMAGFVVVAGSVLLYLFTGKLPSMEIKEGGRPSFGLITPQDVVSIVKEQVEKGTTENLGA